MNLIQKLRNLRKNIQTGSNTDSEALHILKECLVESSKEIDVEAVAYLAELEKLKNIKDKFTAYTDEAMRLDVEHARLKAL